MRAINGHPAFDHLEVVEHALTIDPQIANDRELAHRLKCDGILRRAKAIRKQLVNKRGAALAYFAVDDHGARAAHFFKTVAIPNDGCRLLPIHRHRIAGDSEQATDHIGLGPLRHIKLLLIRRAIRLVLAGDAKTDVIRIGVRCDHVRNPNCEPERIRSAISPSIPLHFKVCFYMRAKPA